MENEQYMAKKIFSEFRDLYPEYWRRGTSYIGLDEDSIEVRIPEVGKLIYNYYYDEIEWLEKYEPIQKEDRSELYIRFKQAVENYIDEYDVTHQEFADYVDISRQMLSKYLNGDAIPKIDTMRRICKIIDIDI